MSTYHVSLQVLHICLFHYMVISFVNQLLILVYPSEYFYQHIQRYDVFLFLFICSFFYICHISINCLWSWFDWFVKIIYMKDSIWYFFTSCSLSRIVHIKTNICSFLTTTVWIDFQTNSCKSQYAKAGIRGLSLANAT